MQQVAAQRQETAAAQTRTQLIKCDTKEYPLEALVRNYGSGEVCIPGDPQKMTWDEATQSKFIETLLLGLPTPYIFVADILDAENSQGCLEIVDGTPRILTLVRFFYGRTHAHRFGGPPEAQRVHLR